MNNGLSLLLATVDMFKYSQGYYSRLSYSLSQLSEDELEEVGHQFDDCKTTLDVVMKLECE